VCLGVTWQQKLANNLYFNDIAMKIQIIDYIVYETSLFNFIRKYWLNTFIKLLLWKNKIWEYSISWDTENSPIIAYFIK